MWWALSLSTVGPVHEDAADERSCHERGDPPLAVVDEDPDEYDKHPCYGQPNEYVSRALEHNFGSLTPA